MSYALLNATGNLRTLSVDEAMYDVCSSELGYAVGVKPSSSAT